MGPGNRADLLVRCPVGSFQLFSNQVRRRELQAAKGTGAAPLAGGGAGNAAFTQLIASVTATNQGDVQCTMPTFSVKRPCYLVDLRNTAASQLVTFRIGPVPTINGVSFGIDKPESFQDEARVEAIKDAVARADLYAKAVGYKVKRIVTVSESEYYAPQPQPMMMARMANDAAESTPIAAGEVSLTATVSVTFELTK